MNLSPILLFTYKRLDSLKETVDALKKNFLAKESDLFIFSDGAKNDKDAQKINHVRSYLKTINGFKSINIHESPKNKGLANSIIAGVSQIIEHSETVIVLEDDLLTTPNFLNYMNDALNKYSEVEKVFSISGYSFNLGINGNKNQSETYFLYRGWSWGWATWKSKWSKVDWEVKDYNTFKENKKLQKEFSKGGSDLNAMLSKQMEGSLDSWAIRWFYHQFKVGGLTLYPEYSKIYNNGFDDLATHTTGSSSRYLPLIDENYNKEIIYPKSIEVKNRHLKLFLNKMGIWARIYSKFQTIFSKILKTK
ncbi:glycosyltransferase [uncultured Maribacter sp.]|uniref:glycosyltransferase n=1 Tax=uncultured Maribacter sp. TaxID=431308 RepID=UPI00263590DA|nr:glycosyltransferase [uncultured Maribacter sp.]